LYHADTQKPLASWQLEPGVGPTPWPLNQPLSSSADDQPCVLLNRPDSAYVLDLSTGRQLSHLTGHAAPIYTALLLRNGKRVFTLSQDHTAKLWNADTGAELLSFTNASPDFWDARSAAVSRDGQRLLVFGDDGLVVRSASPGLVTGRFTAEQTDAPAEPDPKLWATRYQPREFERMTDLGVPLRDPRTPPQQLDLSDLYNTSIRGSRWSVSEPGSGSTLKYDLSWLPVGHRTLAGIPFDSRGALLLASRRISPPGPIGLNRVYLGRFCQRIHFLHGSLGVAREGAHVAHYLLHDSNGATNAIPVVYGQDLRDCLYDPQPLNVSASTTVAWEGRDEEDAKARLFMTTWENPNPGREIESVDLLAGRTDAAAFLVAITIEDAKPPTPPRKPGLP
jgi:hypothetical protein